MVEESGTFQGKRTKRTEDGFLTKFEQPMLEEWTHKEEAGQQKGQCDNGQWSWMAL
jgi:hypothetical protein